MENLRALLIVGIAFVGAMLLVLYGTDFFKKLVVKKNLQRIVDPQKKMGLDLELLNLVASANQNNKLLEALSNLSVPKDGWQNSEIKLKFIRAGVRDPNAALIYYATKTVGTIFLPILLAGLLLLISSEISGTKIFLIVSLAMGLGYYGPDYYLKIKINKRQKDMQDSLPDLIDLLVICTESGLGLDAAINRVSKEIVKSSQNLAEEFYLTSLEIRAGGARMQALKNLALRIDIEDLNNLVSMLTQADKFGTSLAESLRIQSDVMRTRRLQRAEEMASKIPVKMLLPLIFFMFPAILIVLIGPAIISISISFAR